MSQPVSFDSDRPGAKPASRGCMGKGLVILSGLAFALCGLFGLCSALHGLYDYLAMKSWREVPARVLEARVTSHHGSSGYTYGIAVSYEYEYGGVTRRGTRAGVIDNFHDNPGNYYRRIVARLTAARAAGRSVPCYVNPANPAEAVLDRGMRWGAFAGMLLFSGVFLAVGLGLPGVLMFGSRRGRAAKARLAMHPEAPWRGRRDWAAGEIRSSSNGEAIALTVFMLVWNSMAILPLVLGGREIFAKGPSPQWLVLLFPAVGVVLLVVAARAWLAWRVFGRAVFRLSHGPGVIGGVLAGTIRSACTRRPGSGVRLTLTCAERQRQGREKHERILWQDSRELRPEAVRADPTGLAIPVLFQIPFDAAAGSRAGDESNTHWRLSLEGDFGGTAAKARFEVPVFRTAESDANFKPDKKVDAAFFKTPEPDEILKAAALSIEPIAGGGRRYHFRPNRPLSMVLFLSIFTLIWTAVSVGLWFFHGPLVLRIIFPLTDLIPLFALVDILLWSGRADVTPRGVTFAGGILNNQKTVFVTVEDIQRFSLKNGMSSGEQIYYNLLLETRSGKKVTLGKRLKERSHGEWLIEEMEKDVLGEMPKVGAELNA